GDRLSALLFQARNGSLTVQQQRWELLDADPSCRRCGAPEETIHRTMMDCPRLGTEAQPTLSLVEFLGLSEGLSWDSQTTPSTSELNAPIALSDA
ncbi:hypothetical protein MTO96_044135, partial [Rhipicephalus appendiculatus]